MRWWWFGSLFLGFSLVPLRAQDDLPQAEAGQPLEIEPPVLIQSRAPDGTPNVPVSDGEVDLAKLESDLAKAKKSAASGERLYRAGIIAKVESEERAMKVVRLEARLAAARLELAKHKLDEQKTQNRVVEIEAQLRAGEDQVAAAARAAEEAATEQRRAELDAALRNLERQQKLLALGSGRKADVSRAQKKLAELQGAGN